jgi:hypothetical protein
MEDIEAPSAAWQAGKASRGRSDRHFRHPACVENRMPLARRSTSLYNRYNRWSQRRVWQRIFEKMAAVGPLPDELSIDGSHVKAHRSAAGSKRGSSRKRLAVRAAEERAKSMLWPMIAADRSPLRSGECCRRHHGRCVASCRGPDQSGCWQTKLTTPTACANGSSKGRSKQSFRPPPHDGHLILWIAKPTNAATALNACSASLRTGGVSQPDMTAMRKTISLGSLSQPS